MAESIDLFSDNGKDPLIPVVPQGNSVDDKLISKDISEAILGEYVKSIIIPESLDIVVPNYVLDFRGTEALRKHEVESLACLVDDEDGDIAIYACLGNGLVSLGMGVSTRIERILPVYVQSLFGNSCRLYRDIERGKPLQEIKRHDVSKLRLRL